MNGLLVVDKPEGLTSHDVVGRVRRILGTRRVGHTGTLDPIATGVLVVCVGHATRIAEYLSGTDKVYLAGIRLGMVTSTDDVTGTVERQQDASWISEQRLRDLLPSFVGDVEQMPPMFSAVKVAGKRLYELARAGQEVERRPRVVRIHALELVCFRADVQPALTLRIRCAAGTYVRALARDIGEALGVGGVMTSLRRESVGPFTLDQTQTLEQLEEMARRGTLREAIVPIMDALADWPRLVLSPAEASDIRQGRATLAGSEVRGRVLLLDESGEPVAVAEALDGMVCPRKVFPTASEEALA